MPSRNCLVILALVVTSPLSAQQAPPAAPAARATLGYDSLAFGRQLTGWLLAGEADSLWEHTALSTRLEWGSENRWREIVGQFKAQLGGGHPELLDERWAPRGKRQQYWAVMKAPGVTPVPYVLRWVLDPTGVAALGVMPYSEAGPSTPATP